MGYQFIHYNKYNCKKAIGIIAEVMRTPGFCSHVEKKPLDPKPPIIHFVDEKTLLALPSALAEQVKGTRREYMLNGKKVSRGLRADSLVLMAGVVSFPRELAEDSPSMWDFAKRKTIEKLKREYGSQLIAVLEHTDEPHPHLHFYVVPDDLDMEKICVALQASNSVDPKRKASTKKARKAEEIAALQRFQDRWHEEVMADCGLARYGPKRQRVSRAEWKAQQFLSKQQARTAVKADATHVLVKGVSWAMLMQQKQHKTDTEILRKKLYKSERDRAAEVAHYKNQSDDFAAQLNAQHAQHAEEMRAKEQEISALHAVAYAPPEAADALKSLWDNTPRPPGS